MSAYRLQTGDEPETAREAFAALTATLYRDAPLRSAQKERWDGQHFLRWFLLLRGSDPVAKAVLYFNAGLNAPVSPAYLVGNYDACDDESAAHLLAEIKADAAARGGRCLIGPMNGSTWDDYRFALDLDKPLFFTETFHQRSYPGQFLGAGFSVLTEYVSHLDDELPVDEPYIAGLEKRFESQLSIRPIDLDRYKDELIRVHRFCLLAFRDSVLFSPITEEDFLAKYLPLAPLLKPEFVLLAEEGQRLVGLVLCLDDVYNQQSKGVIFKTVARDPGLKYAGLVHLMANSVLKTARRAGYKYSVHAFMHQDNASRAVSRRFVGRPYKRYQLYICRMDA